MPVESSVQRSSLPVLTPLGQFAHSPAIKLSRPVYVLGSKDRCRINLKSNTVSSCHALLVQTRHITYIHDLCSRTGVFINGKQTREAVLHDGDVLQIGKFTFRYQGPKKNYSDEPPAGPAALQVAGAELPIPIEQRAIVIGRRPTCDIPLLEASAAATHAVVFAWEGKRFVRDLWARTGTTVKGKPIHEQELHPGDVIRCGDTDITYAPSLEEATFSVIEGASDSIAAAAPTVEEIDFGLEVVPHITAEQAPLEVILPPQTPPRQQELLAADLTEPLIVDDPSHETAHVPLSLEIEPTVVEAPTQGELTIDSSAIPQTIEAPSTTANADSDLPRRGWRSAIQEADAEVAQTSEAAGVKPAAVEPAVHAPPVIQTPGVHPDVIHLDVPEPVVESALPEPEIIEPTEPTPESALDLPVGEETQPQFTEASADLTDTTFGRSVEEFEGEGLGPIIETTDLPEPPIAEAPAVLPEPATTMEPAEPDLAIVPPPIDLSSTVDASAIAVEEPVVPLEESVPVVEAPTFDAPTIPETPVETLALAPAIEDVPAIAAEEPLVIESPLNESPIDVETLAPTTDIEPMATADGHLDLAGRRPESLASINEVLAAQRVELEIPAIDDELIAEPETPVETADAPTDLHEAPLEKFASISEPPRAPVLQIEPEVSLDDAPIENEPAQMSPDDTAVFVLPTEPSTEPEESAATQHSEADPGQVEILDDSLLLEPLPEMNVSAPPTTEVEATIDESVVVAPPEIHSAPVEDDAPVEEPLPLREMPAIVDEAPAEPIVEPAHAETIALPDNPAEIEPPTDHATQQLQVAAEPVDTEPVLTLTQPASIDQPLDLTRLHLAEDAGALELINNEEPAPHHSDADPGALVATPPGESSIDLSKLAPVEESIQPQQDEAPLTTTLEVASQPPVDDLPPSTTEDPVDLTFLDSSAMPVNEHTAVDVVTEEPSPIESTTIAGAAPDESSAVVDHSMLEHEHEPMEQIGEQTITPAEPEIQQDSIVTSVAPAFPEMLPPAMDDAVVQEPPITEKTEPVPPPIGADSPLTIQPAPSIRPRSPRPRVIRNAFGQDPSAPRPGEVIIPPFSETAASLSGNVTLTGLSQAPVREADVFSEIPRTTSETGTQESADAFALPAAPQGDIFAQEVAKSMRASSLTGLADEATPATPLPPPKARRARPRTARPGVPMKGPRPAVAFADEEALQAAAEHRRKLVRRAPILMGVMVLAIAAAWAAVWFLVPVRSKIETSLNFKNFAAKTQREQRLFQADQGTRFNEEATRNTAVHKLQELHPGTAPGFLQNPEKYAAVETLWPDTPVGEFVMRYDSNSPREDKLRMEAVAMAMYDANSQLADETRDVKAQLETLRTLTASNGRKIDDLSKQIDHYRELIDQAPSKSQLDKYTSNDKDLEAKYNEAIGKAKDAQADLERLKQQQDKDAAVAIADPTTVDDEIQTMTHDADALSTQLTAARKSRADMAAQARATLDAAYDEFKKQSDTAQDAAKASPQLSLYVTNAQNMQQVMREFTDDFIAKEQKDYDDLHGITSKFETRMTDKRATILANDPKLKSFNEQKEILTRKHNEAINSGLDKEASDLANDLKLVDTMIKTQQELVANDPDYNAMINDLQQYNDQKLRSIADARKKIDEKLVSLQQTFNKSAAGVDKMPEDQKEIATKMRDRLVAIDAARRAYAEAADASAADSDVDIKRMKDDLHAQQTKIETRKKQLAAASSPELRKAAEDQRVTALAAKTQEVEKLNTALADARSAYETNHTNLLKGTASRDQAQSASDQLEAAVNQRDTLSRQKEQNDRELALKQEQAKRAIEPVQPTADDVHIVGDPIDNRAQFGLGISGGIFLLFAMLIIATLRSAAREHGYTYSKPAPIEPLETPATPKIDAEENEAAVA